MRLLILILVFVLTAGMALAHGNGHDDDDEAEVEAPVESVNGQPTYQGEVRAILEANCVGCHSEGSIAGYSPLTDAAFVTEVADDIAWHVHKRYMPPWMPSALSVPLKGDRRLSEADIATIVAWADGGAPMGDETDYAPPETVRRPVEIRADLALQPDEAYAPDPDVLDDYRCFGFELPIDAPQFVTAYEFVPEVVEMAHHGIAYLVDAAAVATMKALDGADGKPGWSCYGGSGLQTDGNMIATWTPGSSGVRYPAGTGFLIKPSQAVVLQMHYNLWTTNAPDRTRVSFEMESGDSGLTALRTLPLSAPVEIPCPSGMEGPQCEREKAIARLAELYGEDQARFPERRLRFCRQTLDDYADNTGEMARGHCDFAARFPFEVTAYGVLGHMHELGVSFRMTLNPDSEAPLTLLDIPRWNFHWQERYQFVEPLTIKPGDSLRMECIWDNRLSDAPRYVVWGEGTSDEMCFGTVLVSGG